MTSTVFNYRSFLKTIPHQAGIYQMFSTQNKLLYVGKAKDLRKRLASYFRGTSKQSSRTQSLVAQIADIKIIITSSETEALLLEFNLIKTFKPRYNILLRDDKSYPYLFLSQHEFPCLSVYRGAKKNAGTYYGPFANSLAVRETQLLLQRLFKLRQCQDSVFKARSRPCLQYQIGRCSAPCVSYISAADYAFSVEFVRLFLSGKSKLITRQIKKLMQEAAEQQNFEQAAYYRDQLFNLQKVQQQQCVIHGVADVDTVVIIFEAGIVCVDVLTVRHGLVLGNKTFVYELTTKDNILDELASFITQYYARAKTLNLPQRIITNIALDQALSTAIVTAIREIHFSQTDFKNIAKMEIISRATRKVHKQWLQLALTNAEQVLQQHLSNYTDLVKILEDLQKCLFLTQKINRIECFDVSHCSGEATIVARVVFTEDGPCKSAYRRYNIKHASSGDDYASLREALMRRFVVRSGEQQNEIVQSGEDENDIPSILIIDGGKGQLQVAAEVVAQKTGNMPLVLLSVAKGEGRKRGAEKIYFLHENKIVELGLEQAVFNFLLRVRDEAHRFAITGQRQKMRKLRQIRN